MRKGSKMTAEHIHNLTLALRGRKLPPFSEEHKKRISAALTGKKASEETRKKLSESHKGKFVGADNPSWKGGRDWYRKLHADVKLLIGSPDHCEICGKNGELKQRNGSNGYDLSNKTGIYTIELENWWFLCRKCHRQYDTKHNVRVPNLAPTQKVVAQ